MPPWASGIWWARPRARAGQGSRVLCLLAGALSLAPCARADDARSAPPDARQVQGAIRQGVNFLQHEQLPSGEFPMLVRWKKRDSPPQPDEAHHGGEPVWTHDSSSGGTSQVLYSLQFLPQDLAADLTTKAAAFLLGEMEAPGVWRYYTKHNPLHFKFVPDMKDTSLSGLALLAHRVSFPHDLHALLRYRNPTGGFLTWMIRPEDIPSDAAVAKDGVLRIHRQFYLQDTSNCMTDVFALAYFAHHGEALPDLCAQLTQLALRGPDADATSPYYPISRHAFWLYEFSAAFPYGVAAAYREGAVCLRPGLEPLAARLHAGQYPDGSWGNASSTALGIAALLDVGESGPVIEHGVHALLAQQQPDGGWPMEDLERVEVEATHTLAVYGSRSVVTGLALEALGKYLKNLPHHR